MMPRPTTKNDLMAAAKENYEKLNLFISKIKYAVRFFKG